MRIYISFINYLIERKDQKISFEIFHAIISNFGFTYYSLFIFIMEIDEKEQDNRFSC